MPGRSRESLAYMKPITEIEARLRKRLTPVVVFRKRGGIVPKMPTMPGSTQQVVSDPVPKLPGDIEFHTRKGGDSASGLVDDFDLV